MDRRQFFGTMTGLALQVSPRGRVEVRSQVEESFRLRLARHELVRGLHCLGFSTEGTGVAGLSLALRAEPDRFANPEAYTISADGNSVVLAGGGEQAVLYAVFEFLERQGAFFGLDGEHYPLEPSRGLILPAPDQPWNSMPRFAVRGLLPWTGFLNCITVFNEEDFRAYFESMLRMRLNTFGMHVYAGACQLAEPYLSFEYGGAGHLACLDTTATRRWGWLPQRTSRFTMGAADLYASEVFGSDAARQARDPWEAAERTQQLLKNALSYAARLGIRTGIGFEPYQIPAEIVRALPPEAQREGKPGEGGPSFDIESTAARDLLETRLGSLLEAYPEVDYVWLWEDEQLVQEAHRTEQILSVTPFRQAHDFLQRHASGKRLVLAGWGGLARHFESFHQRLPGDIIFAALNGSYGWDPVSEAFEKLEDREHWPIPCLEDDPSMWLPQLHVYRLDRDMKRALDFRSQGILGYHRRHRILDPAAGFLARFSWSESLTPAEHYLSYARTQSVARRASRLAQILNEADRERSLLSTSTGDTKDGRAVIRRWSAEFTEGFTYWDPYVPEAGIVETQKRVAEALRAVTDEAASPQEREHLEYLTRHIEFLEPYAEAWTNAHHLHQVLQAAAELKNSGKAEEAGLKVRAEGIPLWMLLAPQVRKAVLAFQGAVATRHDLGTLASLHNKFVRLALIRLRLSLKEFLGQLPQETEDLLAEVTRRERNAAPRLFVPTRPGVLARGERVRLQVVSTGPGAVVLNARAAGATTWSKTTAKLIARKTYEVPLGPFPAGAPFAEYYVAAGSLASPSYLVTLL